MSIPPWVEGYVGLPYERCDCWQLVCRIYREQFGLELPPTPADDPRTRVRALWALAPHWIEVSVREARLGDVLVMTLADQPRHAGLVIEPPYMLHSLEGVGVVFQRFDKHYRMAGAFRHPARAQG